MRELVGSKSTIGQNGLSVEKAPKSDLYLYLLQCLVVLFLYHAILWTYIYLQGTWPYSCHLTCKLTLELCQMIPVVLHSRKYSG